MGDGRDYASLWGKYTDTDWRPVNERMAALYAAQPTYKSDKGYVYLSDPYRKRRISEHRMVWMLFTGTKIPDKMHIHHVNGIKDDNRIENLQLGSGHVHIMSHCYFRRCVQMGTAATSDGISLVAHEGKGAVAPRR
jgi:hypothetical protein